MPNKALKGKLCFHFETGLEGGYWAFQDVAFIDGEQWDYKGLHILENGDYLKIYDPADRNKLVWKGLIDLNEFKSHTENVMGFYIHSEQIGTDRDKWAMYFFVGYRAELTKTNVSPAAAD